MNFSKLKTDYPNTFKRFEQWVEQKFETSLAIPNGIVRNEDAVEWLDEIGAHISISAKQALNDSVWFIPYVFIVSNNIDIDYHMEAESSRKLSTENAISFCFYTLEGYER